MNQQKSILTDVKFLRKYIEVLCRWNHKFYKLTEHTFDHSNLIYLCSIKNHYDVFLIIDKYTGNFYKPFDFKNVRGNIHRRNFINITSEGLT